MRKKVTVEIPLQCLNDQGQDWTLVIGYAGDLLTFDLHWKDKLYPNHSAEVSGEKFASLLRELIDGNG